MAVWFRQLIETLGAIAGIAIFAVAVAIIIRAIALRCGGGATS